MDCNIKYVNADRRQIEYIPCGAPPMIEYSEVIHNENNVRFVVSHLSNGITITWKPHPAFEPVLYNMKYLPAIILKP